MIDLSAYWRAVLNQDAEAMRGFLCEDTSVRWHNTNEEFTREEFIRANCEYPGRWSGKMERAEVAEDVIVCAVHVHGPGGAPSFHCTPFLRLNGDRIAEIDEYWGDDGEAPEWRRKMRIGRPICGKK